MSTAQKYDLAADWIIKEHADKLDSAIHHERDFGYNYFAFKTLERSYLRIDGKVSERPQHMLMRMAVGIQGEDIDVVQPHVYDSPTLFNAGTPPRNYHPASCSPFR